MNSKLRSMALALAGTFVTPVFADEPPTRPDTEQTEAEQPDAHPASDEAAFLSKLHYLNQLEIQFGYLAQERAQSRKVVGYGDMLIRDHEAADRKGVSLAEKKGIVLQPIRLRHDADARAPMDQLQALRALRAAHFDRVFLTDMANDHQEVIEMVQDMRAHTHDSDLKALLDELLPGLQHHRDVARQLLRGHAVARTPTPSR